MKNKSKNITLMLIIIIVLILFIVGIIFALNKNKETQTINDTPKVIFYDNVSFEYGTNNINLDSLINKELSKYESIKLLNGSLIDTMVVGNNQEVKLIATNKEINKEFTLTYNIVDTKYPVISGAKDLETTKNKPIDLLKNIKAVDEVDGELLAIIEGDHKDFKVSGIYELKVVATDKNGNRSEVPFKLIVKDHENQTEIINPNNNDNNRNQNGQNNDNNNQSVLKKYKKYDDLKACEAALKEEYEKHKQDWESNECSSDGIMYYRTLH